MRAAAPVSILVEDALCEALATRLLNIGSARFSGVTYMGNGYGYIKRKLPGFNAASRGIPLLVLADLEGDCAKEQVESWLPNGHHSNLVFRIAVRESESWVLADREGFAHFLGISSGLITTDADGLTNPKQYLVNLASKSRRRDIRESMVPRPGATSVTGPDYNGRLTDFVQRTWQPMRAAGNSPSLARCIKSLQSFRPVVLAED